MVTGPPQQTLPGFEVADRPVTPRPSRIGHVKVGYAVTREIMTRATGFMDEYDFTLNPYSRVLVRLHVLLRRVLQQDQGAAG